MEALRSKVEEPADQALLLNHILFLTGDQSTPIVNPP